MSKACANAVVWPQRLLFCSLFHLHAHALGATLAQHAQGLRISIAVLPGSRLCTKIEPRRAIKKSRRREKIPARPERAASSVPQCTEFPQPAAAMSKQRIPRALSGRVSRCRLVISGAAARWHEA
jgi:hypothetical protein